MSIDNTGNFEIFEIFPWDKNFETGIELIDDQHKKLVNILNQLAAHLANRSTPVILNTVFDELADYADYHFKSEEAIWSKHFKEDPWYTSHERTHSSFIDKVIALKSDDSEKPLDDVISDIVSFLSQWLAYHILDTDKRMAKVVLALGSGATLEEAKIQADKEMSGSMKVLIDTVLTMYDNLSNRTLDLMREKALRKQAEDALFASEERWKFILEDSSENIWDWDIAQGVKYSSESDTPTTVLMFVDPKAQQEHIRIHPADIKRVRSDIQAHMDGETKFYSSKHRILRKNGGWSWVLTRGKVVSRDEQGTATRMIGTHSDVTERELGSLIFHNSSQAIVVTDVNHDIISINPAFTRITGYKASDIIGKNVAFFRSVKHTQQFYDDVLSDLQKNGHWSGEIYGTRKNGEIFPTMLDINAISTGDGNVDQHIALFADITALKNSDLALRRAQKMDAIGQLTGGISHDFNNLLGIILGNLHLIESQTQTDNKQKQYLSKINYAGQRATKLVKQLLNFSRKQSEEMVITDLNQILEKMESLICRSIKPEIEIEYNLVDDLWLTNIDPNDFENSLINLVINARDAIAGQGFVKIETRNSTLDKTFSEFNTNIESGDYVTFSITDNGSGILPQQLAHIFEPFYTTKELGKGTGLGLSMVYSFAERSNGYVDVSSTTGMGTTFTLYLPRTLESTQPSDQDNTAEPMLTGGSETILVVEDEPALLELAKDFLENKGYHVLQATNAIKALAILNKDIDIDLLFSDVIMPGGINGYELKEKALSIRPGLKVLLTSGYTGTPAKDNEHKTDKNQLLNKPYKFSELISSVSQKLGEK